MPKLDAEKHAGDVNLAGEVSPSSHRQQADDHPRRLAQPTLTILCADGPAISEEDHELTLHAERPVVTTEAVPVERMRLSKETVTE
jgi:hypothetical protein